MGEDGDGKIRTSSGVVNVGGAMASWLQGQEVRPVDFHPELRRLGMWTKSWAIGTKPDAGLTNTMLDAALEIIADSEVRPIIHSDRGGHYRKRRLAPTFRPIV